MENNKKATFALVSYLIFLLVVGLWPFDFSAVNNIFLSSDGNGIVFSRFSHVYAPLPDPTGADKIDHVDGITVLLEVEPAMEPLTNVSYLFSIYSDSLDRELVLGQWRHSLILRQLDDTVGWEAPYNGLQVSDIFKAGSAARIAVVSSETRGTVVYVNGVIRARFHRIPLTRDDLPPESFIIIGNSASGKNQWSGTIRSLHVYASEIKHDEINSYFERLSLHPPEDINNITADGGYILSLTPAVFSRYSGNDDHLIIPAVFRPNKRIFLGLPSGVSNYVSHNRLDIFVNLIGFIPLGFLTALFMKLSSTLKTWTVFRLAVVFGVMVSLGIELLQVLIVTRSSSSADLVLNISGTIIGVYIATYGGAGRHQVGSRSPA